MTHDAKLDFYIYIQIDRQIDRQMTYKFELFLVI